MQLILCTTQQMNALPIPTDSSPVATTSLLASASLLRGRTDVDLPILLTYVVFFDRHVWLVGMACVLHDVPERGM